MVFEGIKKRKPSRFSPHNAAKYAWFSLPKFVFYFVVNLEGLIATKTRSLQVFINKLSCLRVFVAKINSVIYLPPRHEVSKFLCNKSSCLRALLAKIN